MKHVLTLTSAELSQVLEALGQRIEHLDANPRDYDPDERTEARAACMSALEYGTRIEAEAGKPEPSPRLGG